MEWTQGSGFSFSQGDTFYDSPHAYEGLWSDALKNFRYCIEVTRATPASPAKLPPKTAKEEPSDDANKEIRPRYPGRVEFKLFVPNEEKTKLTVREACEMTQDEFIRLLISGNSEKVKLKWAETLL